MINSSIYSSNKMDWETPDNIFKKINEIYDFSLDVCASEENKKCSKYFSVKEDGLSKEWSGICWMNPPYGKEISKWLKKALEEVNNENCDTVVCLIPCRPDTKYWHDYVMKSYKIVFLNKRLKFKNSSNMAPFSSVIIVFKKHYNNFPYIGRFEI